MPVLNKRRTADPATASLEPAWQRLRAEVRGKTPAEAATLVLNRMGVYAPAVPVDQIIHALGIYLFPVSAPGWSGATQANDDVAAIWVNNGESRQRQRFTLAHE